MVRKKGFTLIEAIVGIAIFGLIAVTVLPIINSSFIRLSSQKTKAEMIYIGESIIEKIKAFDIYTPTDTFIYEMSLSEIVNLFRDMETAEIILDDNIQEFKIEIIKTMKSDCLWMISVNVYEKGDERNKREVNYQALVPSK